MYVMINIGVNLERDLAKNVVAIAKLWFLAGWTMTVSKQYVITCLSLP